MRAKLPPLTTSPLLRQQRWEAPLPPKIQTLKALHRLQQAVLQVSVTQQQRRQVCAVCVPAQPRTPTQAFQPPLGRAVGIGTAEGERG